VNGLGSVLMSLKMVIQMTMFHLLDRDFTLELPPIVIKEKKIIKNKIYPYISLKIKGKIIYPCS
jgi:hypothetical protein